MPHLLSNDQPHYSIQSSFTPRRPAELAKGPRLPSIIALQSLFATGKQAVASQLYLPNAQRKAY